MKVQNMLSAGILALASATLLPADSSFPDPHNDSCWSSLSALRACQDRAQQQAQANAANCTSYPEYQCFEYYQPPQKDSAADTKSAKRRHGREAEDATEK